MFLPARARAVLTIMTLLSASFSGASAGCAPATVEQRGATPEPGASEPDSAEPFGPNPAAPASAPAASASAAPAAELPDGGHGGRLFDKWYEGKSFEPDDGKTPAADGSGGPFGNGRLKGNDGKELLDPAGHQTRLKNLFGWDLRGAAGIYGPKYQKKKYVLAIDLLTVEATRDDFVRWFSAGHDGIPAYGEVLSPDEIGKLVDFIVAMREGKIARPDQVFDLSTTAPGNYTLKKGADPARGASLIKERCATCHGADGTAVLFDDGEFSLGSHARQKAYEDWMKILNGQPGTAMCRQVKSTDAAGMAQEILDVLAALCDRRAFPAGKAKAKDVPDGDPRCGAYLR